MAASYQMRIEKSHSRIKEKAEVLISLSTIYYLSVVGEFHWFAFSDGYFFSLQQSRLHLLHKPHLSC